MHFLILLFIIIIIPIGSIMPALRFFVFFELTLHLLPQLFFYAILQPQLEGKQHYHLFIKIYYHAIPIHNHFFINLLLSTLLHINIYKCSSMQLHV